MDLTILTISISPFLVLGFSNGCFHCFFAHKFLQANSVDPDQTSHPASSKFGQHCLRMSSKRVTRRERVKYRAAMVEQIEYSRLSMARTPLEP